LSGIGFLGYLPQTTFEAIFFTGMTLAAVSQHCIAINQSVDLMAAAECSIFYCSQVLIHSFLFGILLHYIVRKDIAQVRKPD